MLKMHKNVENVYKNVPGVYENFTLCVKKNYFHFLKFTMHLKNIEHVFKKVFKHVF
jgi:hypothetical protein